MVNRPLEGGQPKKNKTGCPKGKIPGGRGIQLAMGEDDRHIV